VQNDELRWTTGQPHLSAIVQARYFFLFGHTACMPDDHETDAKKISTARTPRTLWMKTIQQELKSNNLSLNEAIDMAQNRPL